MTLNIKQNSTYQTLLILQREEDYLYGGLCISCKTFDELVLTHHQFLHINEKKYFADILNKKRQYSYLLGRYCAKSAAEISGNTNDPISIDIQPGVFSQPIIYSSSPAVKNLQISISHTKLMGAALVFPEAHPMGIDLELMDTERETEIGYLTTTEEKKLVKCFSDNAIFWHTVLWSAKEALSKALRSGLMVTPSILEASSIIIEDGVVKTYFKHFAQYRALSFPIDNHVCSIALPHKTNLKINIETIKSFFTSKICCVEK